MDGDLSRQHRSDQRDRIFLSVPPAFAVAHSGRDFLVIMAVAILARYGRHLAGIWRSTYVVASMIALYLNVFVLVVQLFQKVPALKTMAPTQSEPPFVVTQVAVLALFVMLSVFATIRFRTEQFRAA
jgi:hypothetical protein